jgi:hypothetical protein
VLDPSLVKFTTGPLRAKRLVKFTASDQPPTLDRSLLKFTGGGSGGKKILIPYLKCNICFG